MRERERARDHNCNVLYANSTLIILNSSLTVLKNIVTLIRRFLDKTGRGWSRDAVINAFKMKLEDFLVMIGIKLLVTEFLKNTFPYTTPFKNSEKFVKTQALIYLSIFWYLSHKLDPGLSVLGRNEIEIYFHI